ncbi:unnamed protein product [Amoebophrya sp. A120]|nr:unnamed protein product [Amoebophrya sp. A120]|eukprot:GSA120T00008898001.1
MMMMMMMMMSSSSLHRCSHRLKQFCIFLCKLFGTNLVRVQSVLSFKIEKSSTKNELTETKTCQRYEFYGFYKNKYVSHDMIEIGMGKNKLRYYYLHCDTMMLSTVAY